MDRRSEIYLACAAAAVVGNVLGSLGTQMLINKYDFNIVFDGVPAVARVVGVPLDGVVEVIDGVASGFATID